MIATTSKTLKKWGVDPNKFIRDTGEIWEVVKTLGEDKGWGDEGIGEEYEMRLKRIFGNGMVGRVVKEGEEFELDFDDLLDTDIELDGVTIDVHRNSQPYLEWLSDTLEKEIEDKLEKIKTINRQIVAIDVELKEVGDKLRNLIK